MKTMFILKACITEWCQYFLPLEGVDYIEKNITLGIFVLQYVVCLFLKLPRAVPYFR